MSNEDFSSYLEFDYDVDAEYDYDEDNLFVYYDEVTEKWVDNRPQAMQEFHEQLEDEQLMEDYRSLLVSKKCVCVEDQEVWIEVVEDVRKEDEQKEEQKDENEDNEGDLDTKQSAPSESRNPGVYAEPIFEIR